MITDYVFACTCATHFDHSRYISPPTAPNYMNERIFGIYSSLPFEWYIYCVGSTCIGAQFTMCSSCPSSIFAISRLLLHRIAWTNAYSDSTFQYLSNGIYIVWVVRVSDTSLLCAPPAHRPFSLYLVSYCTKLHERAHIRNLLITTFRMVYILCG